MDSKWFLRSKRVWGIIIASIGLFVELPPGLEEQAPELIQKGIDAIIIVIGVATTLYGYFKREKKLTVLPANAPLPWKK